MDETRHPDIENKKFTSFLQSAVRVAFSDEQVPWKYHSSTPTESRNKGGRVTSLQPQQSGHFRIGPRNFSNTKY
jgi:hypothetical protein